MGEWRERQRELLPAWPAGLRVGHCREDVGVEDVQVEVQPGALPDRVHVLQPSGSALAGGGRVGHQGRGIDPA